MKLYKIVDSSARTVDWAGTQADAKASVKTYGDGFKWEDAEVPTDKPGLLAWLKAHAVEAGE